jgi:serine/threonine-protein kinase RsbT
MVREQVRVGIENDTDIIRARQKGRELAISLGFSRSDSTLIATAISELTRNIMLYAFRGEITITPIEEEKRHGLVIVVHDNGPGIPNIELAMQDGYSTGNSLGLGLPGARRLVDDFQITSELGIGTTITMAKWIS